MTNFSNSNEHEPIHFFNPQQPDGPQPPQAAEPAPGPNQIPVVGSTPIPVVGSAPIPVVGQLPFCRPQPTPWRGRLSRPTPNWPRQRWRTSGSGTRRRAGSSGRRLIVAFGTGQTASLPAANPVRRSSCSTTEL